LNCGLLGADGTHIVHASSKSAFIAGDICGQFDGLFIPGAMSEGLQTGKD
jgi:hypothetical protein